MVLCDCCSAHSDLQKMTTLFTEVKITKSVIGIVALFSFLSRCFLFEKTANE